MKRIRLICRTAAVLLLVSIAGAQEYRGTILGRVTDASGSAVAGAKVTAINEATNAASTATSASDGAYLAPFLIPGKYRLEVEAAGFRNVAAPLQVGAIAESITVTADAPRLPPTSCW